MKVIFVLLMDNDLLKNNKQLMLFLNEAIGYSGKISTDGYVKQTCSHKAEIPRAD